MFWRKKKAEAREFTQASPQTLLEAFGLESFDAQTVTVDSALGVPAVFSAVNFISGTIAGLPLHLYRRTDEGRERVAGTPLANVLHDAVSDEVTSFEWRKYSIQQTLTGGRSFSQIVRNGRNEVREIRAMDPSRVTVERVSGNRRYIYKDGATRAELGAMDVLDLPYMLKMDGLGHYGPIAQNKTAIGVAQAVQEYAAKFFANGGVPPFAVTGNFGSTGAMKRATDDLEAAVKRSSAEGRQALVLPQGLEIKPIGASPEDTQLIETQRFCVEQIARIYNLPPTFLQDLTHGTYSNTEQQDLHFVKHTLKRWVEQFEQEMNLKLFGRRNDRLFVEFSMDGLLRGDFKTRMEGHSTAIQAGMQTPNEARAMENRPPLEGGDDLLIQGATVPLGTQEGTDNDDT